MFHAIDGLGGGYRRNTLLQQPPAVSAVAAAIAVVLPKYFLLHRGDSHLRKLVWVHLYLLRPNDRTLSRDFLAAEKI